MEEAICIGCGCTDSDACPEGCYWLREPDPFFNAGVCSSCPEAVPAFDAGEREYAPPNRGLILPGDPDFSL